MDNQTRKKKINQEIRRSIFWIAFVIFTDYIVQKSLVDQYGSSYWFDVPLLLTIIYSVAVTVWICVNIARYRKIIREEKFGKRLA